MKPTYTLLCLLLLTACLAVPSAARGGRGRGGGSFGGLFGGWRSKYGSKSSSSGGGRRVVSGSPVHTAVTVPKLPPPPPPPPQPAKGMSMAKPQAGGYPRQQLPPGYGYAPAAGQGTYYANAQTLPAGAVYYAQPPTSLSMGSGTSFLTGMLAGRLLFGHHHHVSHVYPQTQPGESVATGNGREVIIINNGQPQGAADETEQPPNESLSPDGAVNPLAREEEEQEEHESDSSEETANTTAMPEPPVGGIVCFPIMLNETDPQNSELVREVERVVCFPAPTRDSVDCQNDPMCLLELGGSTTSTEPPIVAGDIGGASEASDSPEASSPSADVDAAHE
ncbi:uncharacterized protein LOC115758740 [Drosophila novamexicana]|uniref:uncharacterized protein LOC115758740 n=1 Tax=Drosophila novamexicana TaxID=47314 RepID=UPI0011E5CB3C|nr:uncharacterized protein LOC115758740 [Drosophila novamexicana]